MKYFSSHCSDDLTMETINLTGVELPKVLGEYVGTCLLDISQIVLILFTAKKMSYLAGSKRGKEMESDEETVPLRTTGGRDRL